MVSDIISKSLILFLQSRVYPIYHRAGEEEDEVCTSILGILFRRGVTCRWLSAYNVMWG